MKEFKPLVSADVVIEAKPSEIWDVLTHKTGVIFMGAVVTTDWHEGHRIRFAGEWKGKAYEDKGVVKLFDRDRRLAFTHFSSMSGKADSPENYNLVSIDLTPRGDATTNVTLTQSIAKNAEEPDGQTVAEFKKNWIVMLSNLKTECERAVQLTRGAGRATQRGRPTVIPRVITSDVGGLVRFLRDVFGAEGKLQEERPSELRIGDSILMISDGGGIRALTSAFLHVYVDDLDATHLRAVGAGVVTLEAPALMPWGDRRATVTDPWGNIWQMSEVPVLP